MPKNKFIRFSKEIVIESITWGVLYLAFIDDVVGANNIAHTLIWILAALGIFMAIAVEKEAFKKVPYDWIYKAGKFSDFLVGCCFIWFGSTTTGVVYILATFILLCHVIEANKDEETVEHE